LDSKELRESFVVLWQNHCPESKFLVDLWCNPISGFAPQG